MAVYPGAIATDADLYIAVNNKSTFITDNPLSAVATTVNVNDATQFPSVGAISIDAEIIHYTGKTATSFTGCVRAFDNTIAASHAVNTPGYHYVIADHHNVLKDEIKAIETALGTNPSFLPLAGGSLTGNLYAPNGLVTAPSYSFANDAASGLRYITAAGPAMVVSSNDVMQWTATVIQALQPIAMNSQKITGLAAGSTNGDAVRYEQVVFNSGDQTITGIKTFSGQLIGKGTSTNDSAASGYIGELLISSVATGSTNITTTLTFQDFTSISLTAGDWDVSAFLSISDNGATWSACGAAISVYSGEPNTDQLSGTNTLLFGGSAARVEGITIPSYRISLSSTTTVYLKGRATFTAGNPAMSRGHIRARRVR